MSARRLMGAKEVADQLGVSKAYAYKVIRKLNGELEASGHLTVAGKVSAEYFEQRFFCSPETREEARGNVGEQG